MTNGTYNIRCPFCLTGKDVPKDIDVHAPLMCEGCQRPYLFSNALPGERASSSEVATEEPVLAVEVHSARITKVMLVGAMTTVLALWGLSDYAESMDGPTFVTYYLIVGFVILMSSNVIRWNYLDSFYVSTWGALIFVGLAILRYIDASSRGLDEFTFMWVIAVIGFISFYFRTEINEEGDRHTTFFGTCGGCGSSGCSSGCGGGCGGCG